MGLSKSPFDCLLGMKLLGTDWLAVSPETWWEGLLWKWLVA